MPGRVGAHHDEGEAMADKQPTQAHHRMLKDLGGGLILRRVAAGHTGEVKVSFYGGGFELKRGRLSPVEH